jgi:hypothetical protein
MATHVKAQSGPTLVDEELAAFRSTQHGHVLVPGDPGYDEARSVWNGDVDRLPAVIARCSTAEDVAAAIQFGRRQGLEISVRGGGHSFAGFSVCDGGLMINLQDMREVAVDPAARRARCGGGATWPTWMPPPKPMAWRSPAASSATRASPD